MTSDVEYNYDDLISIESDPHLIIHFLRSKMTGRTDKLMTNILQFIKTNKGDLASELTQEYIDMATRGTIVNTFTQNSPITFSDYMEKMSHLYEGVFECLEEVSYTKTAQLFLFNLLQAIYDLLMPVSLQQFDIFVHFVVHYVKHKQEGNICIFNEGIEALSNDFFENVVVGSFLALGYLYATICRSINTDISKIPRKNKQRRVLQKKYLQKCRFFDTIDTKTFQTIILEKMGLNNSMTGGIKIRKKTRRRKSRKKHIKKRAKKQTRRRNRK